MSLLPEAQYSLEQAILAVSSAFEEAGLFYGHGTDNAVDEAAWLVLTAADLSPVLDADYSQVLTAAQLQRCRELAARRIEERLPFAYLGGSAWFAGHRFLSDERALVPRSPLAEFIVNDFYGVLGKPAPRILDLCTGGGCIAIASAYQRPASQVVGSDLSDDALSLARENVALHGLEDRVELVHSDLFDGLAGQFDLIISNPPYVDAPDVDAMPAEFRHEPMMGLAAGGDGLDIVRRILAEAKAFLSPGGVLVVETGNSAEALLTAFPSLPFQWLDFEQGGDGVFLLLESDLA